MDEKEAKELCKQPLGKGSLTGDEPWVQQKSLVTTETTTMYTKCTGKVAAKFFIKSKTSTGNKDDDDDVEIFEDFSPPRKQKKKTKKSSKDNNNDDNDENDDGKKKTAKDIFVTKDPNGKFMRTLKLLKRGRDQGAMYLYTDSPAFDGQKQAADEKLVEDSDDDDDGEAGGSSRPLYVFGRIRETKNDDSDACYSMLSYCKGFDADNESGYAWKDIYKAIRKPQFQFAGSIFDMDGNVICKARQESLIMAHNVVYEVAPGADLLAIAAVSYTIEPDGAQCIEALETALDIATIFLPIPI